MNLVQPNIILSNCLSSKVNKDRPDKNVFYLTDLTARVSIQGPNMHSKEHHLP